MLHYQKPYFSKVLTTKTPKKNDKPPQTYGKTLIPSLKLHVTVLQLQTKSESGTSSTFRFDYSIN